MLLGETTRDDELLSSPEAPVLCAPPAESGIRSPEEARRWFQDLGRTVVDWALQHGFNPSLVNAVLAGKRKCLRGKSHAIAVALRLKAQPDEDGWDPDEGGKSASALSVAAPSPPRQAPWSG